LQENPVSHLEDDATYSEISIKSKLIIASEVKTSETQQMFAIPVFESSGHLDYLKNLSIYQATFNEDSTIDSTAASLTIQLIKQL
jgi:hypothetical protein